jgi:3-oxoacyl-[acyl-carrier protein] reductase
VSLGGNVLGSGTKTEKLDLLKKLYPNIKVKRFDMAEHQRVEEFIDNVSLELGGLDILINNAGTNMDNLSLRMKDDEWKKVIDINLTSTFLLSKYAIKKMLKNKYGRIVNITSVVGHTGNSGQSNYAASKAGIVGMSKSLAIEYAKKNITVNCVSPGFIVSDMTMNIAEKVKLYLTSRIPMGKLGTGEDVSNCVAFLSSEQASHEPFHQLHMKPAQRTRKLRNLTHLHPFQVSPWEFSMLNTILLFPQYS